MLKLGARRRHRLVLTMPTYYVSFTADAPTSYPPVATMTAVEADGPQGAVEALMAAGRVPQILGLKWANVAIDVHPNGVPARVMRFAIHGEKGAGGRLATASERDLGHARPHTAYPGATN
jgi:hypothetical protein